MSHVSPSTPASPSAPPTDRAPRLSRRRVLTPGVAALVTAGAGTAPAQAVFAASPVGPGSPAVRAAEDARRRTGRLVQRSPCAAPAAVDIGGRTLDTWAYDGVVPGEAIRVSAGDQLHVSLTNDLPAPTSVHWHWHGLALRGDGDGVPGVTSTQTAPGELYDHRFVVPHPGTYWSHPHVGVQLDTGLMAPLIVEDPGEPLSYEEEAVLVLDDWTDGLVPSSSPILATLLSKGKGMSGTGTVDADHPLGTGTDTVDVACAAHLVDGRLPTAPVTITSSPGRRVRLRIINAADTPYRFAVGGHRLTATHADGLPLVPVEVDTLFVGMGERYDVVVTAGDGAFPVVAAPEGREDGPGLAVLRTSSGAEPGPTMFHPMHVHGHTFAVAGSEGSGTRKDTVSALPKQTLAVDLQADDPAQWLVHCHDAYHGEQAMMTVLSDVS